VSVLGLDQFETLACCEGYDGLFPVSRAARVSGALAALLPCAMRSVYRDNLLAEQLLDRLADLDFVGMGRHFKHVLVESFGKQSSLLRQADVANDLCGKVHDKLAVDALGDLFQGAVGDNHLFEAEQILRIDIR
jgi:hypothetical protein